MDPIFIVLLATVATLVAVFVAQRATSPPSRREVRYLLALLGVGLTLGMAVLLLTR